MNYLKKIFAVIMIAFMVLRVISVDTFALAGAPTLAAEELIEIFAELLLGSGYTQSQIDGMSWNEIETSVRNGVNDGTIDLSGTYYTDPESGALISFYEFLNSPAYVGAESISLSVFKDVVDSAVNSLIGTGLAGIYLHLSDLIKPSVIDDTGTVVDMKGYGAVAYMVSVSNSKSYQIIYCDYIVVSSVSSYPYIDFTCRCNSDDGLCCLYYHSSTGFENETYSDVFGISGNYNIESYSFFGDVRNEDGTPVETADEETYILGDIDGTAITEDMLNPDGTVTIDGVTYYPSDYIDYSNLTDTAQIDLLNEILDTLDRSAVVEQEQDTAYDMVGDVAVELDIAEFNNFVAPAGIADVFPFCLPFDFVRGLQLLAVEPVAPVFEIPFDIPSFGLFDGYEGTVTLDMEKYSTYFEVARWVQVVLFMIGLCFISFKVVKGVH